MEYLDVNKFFPTLAEDSLSDVLVLVPSYQGPRARFSACLDAVRSVGAGVCMSVGVSDVALHRCLVAGRALAVLDSNSQISQSERLGLGLGIAGYSLPELKGHPNYQYLLWLDDDIVFSPAHVVFLRKVVRDLGCAASASYCKRGHQNALTWLRYPGEETQTLYYALGDEMKKVECEPIVAGCGFLMVPRIEFIRHCQSVPNVVAQSSSSGLPVVPAIAACGVGPDQNGVLGWMSEDRTYCEGLWQFCNGVRSCPIAVGHLSEVALLPLPNAQWL